MNIQTSSKTPAFLIGEASFADALEAIKIAPDLDEKTKRYFCSGLVALARYIGEPPETIPARIAAIAHRVRQLHAERLDKNPKTFANNRALAKKALHWFNKHTLGSARSAPMSEEYRSLWEKITDKYARDMLSPFFRFLTGLRVKLTEVTDDHVAAYTQYRRETGFQSFKPHKLRQLVRYWNQCQKIVAGWPPIILTEPDRLKPHAGPGWKDFPAKLCSDIDAYCDGLTRAREDKAGRLLNPCASSTINMRRRVLIAAIRTAVEVGIPLQSLASLQSLLQPKVVRTIIEAYWKRNGKVPSLYTIDLGTNFLSIARSDPEMSPENLIELNNLRRLLERHRMSGLTPKNREAVRFALQDESWRKVVRLPAHLMKEAEARRKTSPVTSAIKAQLAIAIRILVVAPVRIENLCEIEIGKNLVRPSGPGSKYFLTFERFDVKNNIPLDFELDRLTTDLIDRYIGNHRPRLMRGRNHRFLVPGVAADKKDTRTLGDQISKRLWKSLGMRLTAHQFRHAGAALLLSDRPGDYEVARQLLGHKSLRTTISHYIGLETISSTRIFGSIVTQLDEPLDNPPAAPRKGRRRD